MEFWRERIRSLLKLKDKRNKMKYFSWKMERPILMGLNIIPQCFLHLCLFAMTGKKSLNNRTVFFGRRRLLQKDLYFKKTLQHTHTPDRHTHTHTPDTHTHTHTHTQTEIYLTNIHTNTPKNTPYQYTHTHVQKQNPHHRQLQVVQQQTNIEFSST